MALLAPEIPLRLVHCRIYLSAGHVRPHQPRHKSYPLIRVQTIDLSLMADPHPHIQSSLATVVIAGWWWMVLSSSSNVLPYRECGSAEKTISIHVPFCNKYCFPGSIMICLCIVNSGKWYLLLYPPPLAVLLFYSVEGVTMSRWWWIFDGHPPREICSAEDNNFPEFPSQFSQTILIITVTHFKPASDLCSPSVAAAFILLLLLFYSGYCVPSHPPLLAIDQTVCVYYAALFSEWEKEVFGKFKI